MHLKSTNTDECLFSEKLVDLVDMDMEQKAMQAEQKHNKEFVVCLQCMSLHSSRWSWCIMCNA
jgi:hypothetical protein